MDEMSPEEIKAYLMDANPDAIVLGGFDDAIVGVVHIPCRGEVIIYDQEKMIDIYLGDDDDITWSEAVQYLEFNVFHAHLGAGTPVFLVAWQD
jgi:hypothetical protein|tara:strand:+ start:5057 stop:5335 length:279 start_codon:yes stop_codon:yes gene_type:complete